MPLTAYHQSGEWREYLAAILLPLTQPPFNQAELIQFLQQDYLGRSELLLIEPTPSLLRRLYFKNLIVKNETQPGQQGLFWRCPQLRAAALSVLKEKSR